MYHLHAWVTAAVVCNLALITTVFYSLPSAAAPAALVYGSGHVRGIEVTISAETAGRVVDVNVVEGANVVANELLIRLDDAIARAELARAEAQAQTISRELDVIRLQLATRDHHQQTTQTELTRYRKLGETGAISGQQLDDWEDRLREIDGEVAVLAARLAQTEARWVAAERGRDVARLALAKTEIRAPLAGVVLSKNIDVGEQVSAGETIVTLMNLSSLQVRVIVRERDIGNIKPGHPARIAMDAFPARYFDARVVRIEPRAQLAPEHSPLSAAYTRMVFGVVLALDLPFDGLKPGMMVDAWIQSDANADWPTSCCQRPP